MGPISTWPQSLKTAVRILITSRYSMWMGWGPDLIFLYNDAYAQQTLGKKHPWALGIPAREVWAEIWADLDSRVRTVMETGEATWDEGLLLFLERSGYPEETYHTFSYSPLTDDDGKISGLFCVVMEETERVIGERQLGLLRHLAAGLSSKNTEEDVCKAIPASLKTNPQDLPVTLVYLFENGETRARLACETGIERSHPAAPARIEIDAADAVWPIRDLLKTKGPVFVENLTELFGSMPTGAWDQPPTRAILVPITGQGQDRPAGVFITAVNPYRQLNAGYSGFIYLVAGQIAAGIANARAYEGERQRAEVLAALDRAKTTFFSNVSHEFRTPLTLMLGPTEDALANPEKALRGRELETVHRNELRLLKLVNTLLDFSRLEAGRVTASYQPTDLCAYTLELASIFRSAIEKAGLNYVVDCKTLPQPVYIDREMWEKIVLNLISNALKSTFHGSIELELVNKADHIEFEVRDTGTGIPEHELPHLFERFRRVEHARRRTHEGSGIGLALVHELLAMHGGKITVQSHVGKGTTFTISLPYGSRHLPRERVRPEAEQIVPGTARKAFVQEALSWLPGHPVDDTGSREDLEAADALSAPLLITSSKPRVLLVDDNRDMREYVRRLLNSRFEVTTAENGRQALEKVNQQIPALVLSDVMMPEMDGLQLLAALRENPATSSVPVVLLSARAGEESLIEGMLSGADDYVVKPFTARELLARVEAHIKIASFRREALETEKRLQSELRASEREQLRLLAVMDQSTDFIGLADMEGRVLYVNKSARAMMGLGEKQDVRQLRIKDFFFPEDVPFLEDVVISTVLREGRWQGEVNFRHFKTGASISVDYHVFPVNDPQTGEMVGLATVTRDMRERKEAEAALRASESRYRVLAELSPQALWTTDKEGQVLYANRRFLDYAGKQSLPRDPQEYLNLFHEEDRERALAAWMHSVTTGEDFAIDVRLVRAADGAARWWHLRALPLRDEAGAIERWLGVADDVHEGRMAEQAVRIERARLVEMFRQAPAFMAMLRGPEHIFERTNRQYQELIGNRDVVGKPMRQALPEAEEQGFITLLDRVYETGEPFVATGRSLSVARIPGQPLEEHYLDFVYQPMRETDGTISGVLVLGVDVTERKRTEAALLQSEKLAAVGRLSASIAHEINNPLEAVTNLLYLLNEEKDLPEQARALLIWRNKSWRA
jgi:PAS domain S-box-containing protein